MQEYDLVVIGGGMTGAAFALGAGKQGKKVALIEGVRPQPYEVTQPMDIRVSAISLASIELLKSLQCWADIEAMRVTPYRRLETWEQPECRTTFSADDLGVDILGYMVENRLIQLGLWAQIEQQDNITLFCPDSMKTMCFSDTHNIVTLESGRELKCSLVVGADGANSNVRSCAGIGLTAWDYRQACMLINVETEKEQQDITWQWFTPHGPRSFLPLQGKQGSLVWYDKPSRVRQLVAMSKEKLAEQIHTHFPSELGNVRVLQAGSFPLVRRHAQCYFKNRCVLVGDSAHTINPLAGQGVNLGFKDVKVLLEILATKEWQSEACLLAYEKRRRLDNLVMQSGMDFFYKTFSNDIAPIKFARNAALKIANTTGPIKNKVLKYALGL
ncbi:2-octaprenyl-3-methyl-6-methoxy-1,4-benzoquinol hydroxylase [Vibrio sp. TH_r3]|uniref:2-octaprenyl-3-methyl-6-methoxy-1,4-benzoquinol hydroxylase n=1 Tax=Vibrio sp. TH_r3 TaxID=3082084 RepID=UPI00295490DF|nr:2-octaprenyl-3-methyl-6-methoxy-1,4-benzoquinol hydroxylase [Vibrio sp. TH_r3]MDV7104800.1 2-octaprenyl-3-methyl-6-methoxy-1,4-benzoquinol hydroxylase [Vibrio sp. TH_r3]